jgi:hypothetical protein
MTGVIAGRDEQGSADIRLDGCRQRHPAGDAVAGIGCLQTPADGGVVGLPDRRANCHRTEIDGAAIEGDLNTPCFAHRRER